jgi:hypothetical protein
MMSKKIDDNHVKYISVIKNHMFELEYILIKDKDLTKKLYDMIIKLGKS